MDVSTCRAPDQSGFVQFRVDVAERGRPELIGVVGKLPLEKIVTGWTGRTPRHQLIGHGPHSGSQGGQWTARSCVDIGSQHPAKLGHHDGAGLGHDRGDVLVDHGDTTGSGRRRQTTMDPSRQGSVDTVGQGSGEIGQLGLVVNQRRFGLRVHPLRLR